MTPQEAAERLNNNPYGDEGSEELFKAMKAAGLVAVFGASDDLVELRGAIYDEEGGPGTIYVDENGLVKSECDEGVDCPYFKRLRKTARKIEAVWCPDGTTLSWGYETDIPFTPFNIMNDEGEPGDIYCVGIVFALKDAKAK